MIKIEITDTCFKRILKEYIEVFPFNGKGIYLATIKSSYDTTKYYLYTVFSEQNLEIRLKYSPYYLYDTINQRIVIIHTKFERFIENKNTKYECDTILKKFYDKEIPFHSRGVYLMEFIKYNDTITRDVIYYDPFSMVE